MEYLRRPHVVLTVGVCLVAFVALTVSAQRRNTGFSQEKAAPTVVNPFAVAQSAVECQAAAGSPTTSYTFQSAAPGNNAFFSPATKNDLLVAVASSSNAATIGTPAGFTQVFQEAATSGAPTTGAPQIALFYKVSAGTEQTVTFSFSSATRPCIGLIEYTGTSINAPLHGKSIGYNGSGTVVPLGTGTIDIISPTDLGVAFFANNSGSTTASNYTAPPAGDHYVDPSSSTGVFGGNSTTHISMFYVNCIVGSCAGTTSTTTTTASSNFAGFIASFYPKVTSGSTGTGSNVTTTSGNSTVTFNNVTGAGTTTATSIDPTSPSQGAAPSGITYNSSSPAYDIATTATFTGTARICIHIPDINPAAYPSLKLLHKEGGVLVDRTAFVVKTSQKICGDVTSFSPFIVASGSTPTAASVNISGRVMTADGRGIRNATVLLNDQYGKTHTVRTSAFGYYVFDAIASGETYVLNVSSRSYTFLPRVVNVSDSLTNLDLIAFP